MSPSASKSRRRGHRCRFHQPPSNKEEEDDGGAQEEEEEEEEDAVGSASAVGVGLTTLSRDPQVCLALYIAMAHAGLALSLALLYGLARLLQGFWRPIQWALLCSIPLRQLHTALVSFWSLPLRRGLLPALLAIPLAALRSLSDSRAALLRLLLRRHPHSPPAGFSKLTQWLLSFALFLLLHERAGPLFALPALLALAHARPPAAALSALSSLRRRSSAASPPPLLLTRLGRLLASRILARLNTLVAIGLIILMILGSVSGLLFFSYKMGIEGRDALFLLKSHLERHDYAQRIGLRRWITDRDLPALIDSCTSGLYDSVSRYLDSLALQYNATELLDGFRHYLIRPLDSSLPPDAALDPPERRPFSQKLGRLLLRVHNQEWKVLYAESHGLFTEFLSVITREDLVDKVRGLALQSIDVSKRIFASSTSVLAGSVNILLALVVSVVSGAAGLLNFVSELTVFFWLLYYLITSESGGVMDHVLGMFPISRSTRVRCAEVLGNAVSSVLLATAKVALFQGCFTYLLFRFYHIHFLYVSTFLAWTSAILPVTPFWLSSIPAAVQLAVEARYIEAVLLTAVHLVILEYGTSAIQDEIPGQSAYLTGLSIFGGVALFPSALEGAIMGPLLMTVMIAVKNLYAEFVLLSARDSGK